MAETEVVVIPKPRNHLQIKDTLSTMDFSAPTPIAMNLIPRTMRCERLVWLAVLRV